MASFAWVQYSARKTRQERDRLRRIYSYLHRAQGLCALEYLLSKHFSEASPRQPIAEAHLRSTHEAVRRETVALVFVLEKLFLATFGATLDSSLLGVNVVFRPEDEGKVRETLESLYGAGSARIVDPWAELEDPAVAAIRDAMANHRKDDRSSRPAD